MWWDKLSYCFINWPYYLGTSHDNWRSISWGYDQLQGHLMCQFVRTYNLAAETGSHAPQLNLNFNTIISTHRTSTFETMMLPAGNISHWIQINIFPRWSPSISVTNEPILMIVVSMLCFFEMLNLFQTFTKWLDVKVTWFCRMSWPLSFKTYHFYMHSFVPISP